MSTKMLSCRPDWAAAHTVLGWLGRNKIPALIIVVSSVVFLTAAFMPISFVYAERDVLKQIAYVQSRPTAWAISQVLFLLGSVGTVVGLALISLQHKGGIVTLPAYVGFAGMSFALFYWATIVYFRATLPIEQVFREPTFGWLFIAFTLCQQGALIAYGFMFLRAGYPRWLGLGAITSMVTLCTIYLILKDVPPFAYYVVTLVVGIALLFFPSQKFSIKDKYAAGFDD